ncbi:MAG: hypothetical protein U1E60_18945 [Reyranellaceae bacterium]
MRPHPRPSRRLLQLALLSYAPLTMPRPPIVAKPKPASDPQQLDLTDQPAEPVAVHVHQSVDSKAKS